MTNTVPITGGDPEVEPLTYRPTGKDEGSDYLLEKIERVLNDRLKPLLNRKAKEREGLPPVLRKPFSSITAMGNDFCVVVIGSHKQIERFKRDADRSQLLPGLLISEAQRERLGVSVGVHISGRNAWFEDCIFKDTVSLAVGPDCTITLVNHGISWTEIAASSYVIELGFIVSFGPKIRKSQAWIDLDSLIARAMDRLSAHISEAGGTHG